MFKALLFEVAQDLAFGSAGQSVLTRSRRLFFMGESHVPQQLKALPLRHKQANFVIAGTLLGFSAAMYYITLRRHQTDPVLNQKLPTKEEFAKTEQGIKISKW